MFNAMASLRNVLVLMSVAVAAISPSQLHAKDNVKRAEYWDNYPPIITGLSTVVSEATAWKGTGSPDKILAALDNLANAIGSAVQATQSLGASIQFQGSVPAMRDLSYQDWLKHVHDTQAALKPTDTYSDSVPSYKSGVTSKVRSVKSGTKGLCDLLVNHIPSGGTAELSKRCGEVQAVFDSIISDFS